MKEQTHRRSLGKTLAPHITWPKSADNTLPHLPACKPPLPPLTKDALLNLHPSHKCKPSTQYKTPMAPSQPWHPAATNPLSSNPPLLNNNNNSRRFNRCIRRDLVWVVRLLVLRSSVLCCDQELLLHLVVVDFRWMIGRRVLFRFYNGPMRSVPWNADIFFFHLFTLPIKKKKKKRMQLERGGLAMYRLIARFFLTPFNGPYQRLLRTSPRNYYKKKKTWKQRVSKMEPGGRGDVLVVVLTNVVTCSTLIWDMALRGNAHSSAQQTSRVLRFFSLAPKY